MRIVALKKGRISNSKISKIEPWECGVYIPLRLICIHSTNNHSASIWRPGRFTFPPGMVFYTLLYQQICPNSVSVIMFLNTNSYMKNGKSDYSHGCCDGSLLLPVLVSFNENDQGWQFGIYLPFYFQRKSTQRYFNIHLTFITFNLRQSNV